MSESYRKVKPIGSGSIATVYEGWDERLHRPVAIKELSPRFLGNEGFIERFLAEARKMAAVSHANLLAIHHVDQSHETPWLIMELADGGTLRTVVSQGPSQPEVATRILRQLLLGLREVHRRGMVHRGIKPENLFLCGTHWKVGDLGLAKEEDDPTIPFALPRYVAPEALTAGVELTAAADIYALGLVAAELLLGERRFLQMAAQVASGEPGGEAEARQREVRADEVPWFQLHLSPQPLPRLDTVEPAVPAELAGVVARMVAKDPAERFTSCDEVLKALGGEGEAAGAPSISQGVTEPLKLAPKAERRLWPRVVGIAAVALVLFVVAIVLLPSQWVRVDVRSEPPEAQVLFRDEQVGTTPMEKVKVKLGTELVLRKEGFEDARVTLSDRAQKVLEATLVPVASEAPAEEAGAPLAAPEDLIAVLDGLAEGGVAVGLAGGSWGSPPRVPVGTQLRFRLEPSAAGFLSLFLLSSNGTLTCLFPNRHSPAVEVAAGGAVVLPRAEDRMQVTTSLPLGVERVFALLTPSPPPAPPAGEPVIDWQVYALDGGGDAAAFVAWVREALAADGPGAGLGRLAFEVVPEP